MSITRKLKRALVSERRSNTSAHTHRNARRLRFLPARDARRAQPE